MNKFLFTTIALLFTITFSKGKSTQSNKTNSNSSQAEILIGARFTLEYQAFESHDKENTQIDTTKNEGDYIVFSNDGTAYIHFKGKYDLLRFNIIDKNKISFGDTPFVVKNLGNGYFNLYQNEEESNGDYNRVTYLLKEDNDQQVSYSK